MSDIYGTLDKCADCLADEFCADGNPCETCKHGYINAFSKEEPCHSCVLDVKCGFEDEQ